MPGVHRAGASLDVHVHFHVLCLDGVYVEAEAESGTLRFEAVPSREELEETLAYVCARVRQWLARRGLLRNDDASNEAPAYSQREAMTLAGMQRGTLETAKDTCEPADSEPPEPPGRVTEAVAPSVREVVASVA